MRATEYAGAGPTAAASDVRRRALRDLADGRFESWARASSPVPALRIRALVHLGRHDEARAQLRDLTVADLASWSTLDLVSVAFAASRVGPVERCHDLLWVVGERPRSDAQTSECVPTAFVEALCLMAVGHDDGAQQSFARALVAAEQSSPIAGAQVRAEMGRFHLGLGPDRRRSARAHLMAAAVCLRANHLPYLADLATAMLEGDGPVGPAGPHRGVLRPGPCWLVGYGLHVARPVEPSGDLEALHALLSATGHQLESGADERAAIDQALSHLHGIEPAMAAHLRASMQLDDTVAYRPTEPHRWALDPQPVT